jgi:hypothetical protein
MPRKQRKKKTEIHIQELTVWRPTETREVHKKHRINRWHKWGGKQPSVVWNSTSLEKEVHHKNLPWWFGTRPHSHRCVNVLARLTATAKKRKQVRAREEDRRGGGETICSPDCDTLGFFYKPSISKIWSESINPKNQNPNTGILHSSHNLPKLFIILLRVWTK